LFIRTLFSRLVDYFRVAPGAQIFPFDEAKVHQIDYRDSQPLQLVSRFIAAPERYINALFSELPFSKE